VKILVRNKNFWLMLAADVGLIGLAYSLAYYVRFEGDIPPSYADLLVKSFSPVVAVKVLCFFGFHLYRGMWRYTSLVDFINVAKAVSLSSVALIFSFYFFPEYRGVPRSVFVLDFLLTLIFIAGIRLGIRLYLSRGQNTFAASFWKKGAKAKRLLLIGAGNTGEHVLREMMDNPSIQMLPVGFLDDDPSKLGQSIHGVRVLGNVEQIDLIGDRFDEILISAPSATGNQMKRIVAACERTGRPVKTMPPLGELIDGRVSMTMVREVSITDLLGRAEVRLEDENIRGFLQGKRVLVTGAGGSIGSELVRQITRFDPGALGLADVGEYNLYQVDMECRQRFRGIDIRVYLVDLGDLAPTRRVFTDFQPDIVFHAAAYKHVPMQELHPWEAVYNNLLAMRNVITCTQEAGVDKFVMVSSDKAVRPTNVMGATKRICEMMAACANGRAGGIQTRYISVRFGNVLGSSGSVIPLFQQQIARGGPVTVTHPEITRYFMSIPEAAQLILQAGAMGEGREIFILKMGEPVRILDLAKEIIRFHGLEPQKDVDIVFTGLRPGEKLFEELITEGEGIAPTRHEKILVLQVNHCADPALLSRQLDELLRLANTFDIPAIKAKLKEIVPEYTPQ